MKVRELGELLQLCFNAYPVVSKGIDDDAKKNLCQSWHEILGHIDIGTCREAVLSHLRESKNFPTASEIYRRCDKPIGKDTFGKSWFNDSGERIF